MDLVKPSNIPTNNELREQGQTSCFFGWTRRTWRKKRRAKINVSLLNFGNQTGNSFSFVCSLTKDEVRQSSSLQIFVRWKPLTIIISSYLRLTFLRPSYTTLLPFITILPELCQAIKAFYCSSSCCYRARLENASISMFFSQFVVSVHLLDLLLIIM